MTVVAVEKLRSVCASDEWLEAFLATQPFDSPDLMVEAGADAALALSWPGVLAALAAHPRIGERASGQTREATWSRQEQETAASVADPVIERALRLANAEYERRFGYVFLICATGRTRDEVLAALRTRLHHGEATEQQIVRRELADIVRLRLAKIASSG